MNLRFDKADEVLDRTLEFPAIRRIKLILDFDAIVISKRIFIQLIVFVLELIVIFYEIYKTFKMSANVV